MKVVVRIIIVAVFVAVLFMVIAYARGYRFDFEKKTLTPTGIIAINSFPQSAKVFVNGQFKGATSLNLTLGPGNYTIEVKKDGYTSYMRNIKLKGELVLSVDALLFPQNASLSPLTNLGITKAVQVDQTDKIILFSDNEDIEKDGIYVFETGKKPLSFLPPLTPLVFKKSLPPDIDFTTAKVYFSYDYKQAIFEFDLSNGATVSYLFSLSDQNQDPFDVTTSKEALLTAWAEEKQKDTQKILETLPKNLVKVASDSFHFITLSPDETKILYKARTDATLPLAINPPLIAADQTPEARAIEKDNLYIYDKKEDKNFKIPNSEFLISNQVPSPKSQSRGISPTPLPYSTFDLPSSVLWYPDSKHFVIKEEKRASIIDYDGTNKQTVYSGPFEAEFLGVSSTGVLLILANLNPQNNKLPDLYSVGIR